MILILLFIILDENGWSAVHYCASTNASKALLFLLAEEGADKHLKDMNKRKAVDIAKFLEYGECIAILSSTRSYLL